LPWCAFAFFPANLYALFWRGAAGQRHDPEAQITHLFMLKRFVELMM
jgi:hypothetical protein